MLAAIQLDRQFVLVAIEVEHVAGYRMLAPELVSVEALVAQQIPEACFCVGWMLAEFAGEAQELVRDSWIRLEAEALTPGPSPGGGGENDGGGS